MEGGENVRLTCSVFVCVCRSQEEVRAYEPVEAEEEAQVDG